MIADLKPYPAMKDSGVGWLGEVPEHWTTEQPKWLFRKMERPVQDTDEVVTCFRDGVVHVHGAASASTWPETGAHERCVCGAELEYVQVVHQHVAA